MSSLRASHRKMMTKKIARLMDINVFIFVSHVFDAFLALGLNDNRDNRDNSLVEQAYRKAINQELSPLSLSLHVALCQPPFLYAFAAWRTRGRLPHVGCGIGHDGIKRHLRGSHRSIERDCMDSYRASCHLAFSFSPLLTGGG